MGKIIVENSGISTFVMDNYRLNLVGDSKHISRLKNWLAKTTHFPTKTLVGEDQHISRLTIWSAKAKYFPTKR